MELLAQGFPLPQGPWVQGIVPEDPEPPGPSPTAEDTGRASCQGRRISVPSLVHMTSSQLRD